MRYLLLRFAMDIIDNILYYEALDLKTTMRYLLLRSSIDIIDNIMYYELIRF